MEGALPALSFCSCAFGVERGRALADLLRQDSFPALQDFSIWNCDDIKDEGVVALAEGLRDAQQTFLRNFELFNVGIGDLSIRAISNFPQTPT